MSIPKTIHYCWFGGNPLPEEANRCIKSWKKYCPDYEIIEWNERNFDVNCNLYCKQAYLKQKWAFVTDYARLWILYHHGGIYFDTDVKILKNFDKLLTHKCFAGIERSQHCINVNTGLGIGSEPGNRIIKALLDSYLDIPFIVNDELDITTCTVRNTVVLEKFGFVHEDVFQELGDITIYPTEYFSPMDMWTGIVNKTKNTYSIHLYNLSWTSEENRARQKRAIAMSRKRNRVHLIRTFPNRVFIRLLGEKYYELKNILKGNNE